MKKGRIIIIICLVFNLSCSKDESMSKNRLELNASLEEIKDFISLKHDDRATHTFQQYRELLETLKQDKFIVLPLNEMKDSFNNQKVMVCIRHDVDNHPFKAHQMALMEYEYGFRATYFLLATSDYYGQFNNSGIDRYKCMEEVYVDLYELDAEIGIHNDLITVMIKYGLDPYVFNQREIQFYESIGILVHGTAAHGSSIASETIPNFEIFSDFAKTNLIEFEGEKYSVGEYSLEEFGYSYEAYFIDYNKYYSDCSENWNFDDIIEKLNNSVNGDRIQILIHPTWWGK